MELCGLLGMELDGLCVSNRGGVGEVRLDLDRVTSNTIMVDSNTSTSMIDCTTSMMDGNTNMVTTDTNRVDSNTNMVDSYNSMVTSNTSLDNTVCDDIVDSVHPRFVKGVAPRPRPRSQSEDSNPSVRVSGPGLAPKVMPGLVGDEEISSKIFSPPPCSPSCHIDSQSVPSPTPSHSHYHKTYNFKDLYFNRKKRLSSDSLAEPLKSFPLKKLPFKTPDIPDNILPESPKFQELSRTSTPAVLQYLQSPQVMLPDTVLTEVMGMVSDTIKQEVEEMPEMSCDARDSVGEIADITGIGIGAEVTYGEGAEDIHDLMNMVDPLRSIPDPPYPQLEGKCDGSSPNSPL
jgi:hypothetical protein